MTEQGNNGGFFKLFCRSKKKVVSLEFLLLRLSSMGGIYEYEIQNKDGQAEVSLFELCYHDGKEERRLEECAICLVEEAVAICNECHLISWDGFHGAHPRHVLDGTVFHLKAKVNGERQIEANGSANFPKRFSQLTNWLNEVIRRKEKKVETK